MSDLSRPAAGVTQREYVLGQELRATVLTSAEETEGRHDIVQCAMPYGQATPLHMHTRYEERIWVVSGSVTVWAGADTMTLRSGDFCTIPMHVPHTLQAGPEDLRALTISSPAGFAELIARAATPADLATPETELDIQLFMTVCAELGDVVLGPPGTRPGQAAGQPS
jgi:mannose-6-phosphate isomerase-like protein (cupin superfamily)